mmetsp:Transcript_19530/g.30073  ORF Transcript_19530/g.30073 Transcript_19530/m.30073 type:complete len:83 (+) Transcript_19530:993-1241(+)
MQKVSFSSKIITNAVIAAVVVDAFKIEVYRLKANFSFFIPFQLFDKLLVHYELAEKAFGAANLRIILRPSSCRLICKCHIDP